jgi:hypothetical protein
MVVDPELKIFHRTIVILLSGQCEYKVYSGAVHVLYVRQSGGRWQECF